MKKIAKNPAGQTVEFDETQHSYQVQETGKYLTSVTTFIGRFFPKFNTNKMASKCVGKPKYKHMTADEIKAVWSAEALRGSSEGTHVHYFAECLTKGEFNNLPKPKSDREAALFDQTVRAVLAVEERFTFLASEAIVFSSEMGLAGTIDLLMLDVKKNDLIIIDWKQNKQITNNNPWDMGLAPITNLEASDFNKYALQLNLYEKILRQENYGDFNSIRKALIHLQPDTFSVIKVPTDRFQDALDRMIYDIPF